MSKSITILLALSAALLGNRVAFAGEHKPSPFVVHGKVTDETGKPLEGVEITARCGMGSLFHTGTAKTGKEGAYRLTFRPGILAGNTQLGVGTQVATILPRLQGWYEIHLGQRGNLLMTEWKDELTAGDTNGYSGVVVADKPYELNFTMTRAARIEGQMVNEFGTPLQDIEIAITGDILPPSCSILTSVTTDDEGRFAFDNLPVWLADPAIHLTWRCTMRPFGMRHELESSSFEVSAPVKSVQKLSLESCAGQNGVCLILDRQTLVGER